MKIHKPSFNLQTNAKRQTPGRVPPSFAYWNLKLLWCWVFGVWCF